MEQLIRFRLLADTLLQNEFDLFIKTSHLNIRRIVLKALFHSFHEQMQTDANNTKLTESIEIMSTIIQSRNAKQLKEIESKKEPTKLSINDLPYPLIGECASYLPFIDHNSLQNVSRPVFIGCNDPNTVTTINTEIFERNFESKQHLQLVKYKKVINFEIDMYYFSKMKSIHNLSLSQETKSLSLNCINTEIIKNFLNMKCFNFDKIEILKITDYDRYVINPDTFGDLLKCFKNMKFFAINSQVITDSQSIFDNEQFRNKIFNHLQGLTLCGIFDEGLNFDDDLLHYFSDKLLSLHFCNDIKCPKNGFINLKEVCIYEANYNTISNIIKTAKKLERIHLQFYSEYDIQNNEFEDILMELLSQNTLEFISIKINDFDAEIEPITKVLQKISFSKRKKLKIMLEIEEFDESENANDYFDILESKFSKDGVIDDWMIIFIGAKVQLFKTNEKCKINGWRERWLYCCDACDCNTFNLKPL